MSQTKELWKKLKKQTSSTLQRRLILFFSSVVICIILVFTLLLTLFGITGYGHQTVYQYMESELLHISQSVNHDFGSLSVTGIALAETLTKQGDDFFHEKEIDATNLKEHPEYLEELISKQMPVLISTAKNNACGGVFFILDATINPTASNAQSRKSGVFLKKTQPVSSATLGAKEYYLRGPASIAREYGIELLGQWIMEFDLSEIPFFENMLQTATENPETALSRLYYWSNCIHLIDNSETGILLCLPLRSSSGTVYGVCGIEVSDQMFKRLYSPHTVSYHDIFALTAPYDDTMLYFNNGLSAGNTYLKNSLLKQNLSFTKTKHEFSFYTNGENTYGGLITPIRLYTSNSLYKENWCIAVLLPEATLTNAIKGNSTYLFVIVGSLLIVSLTVTVFISKHYLHPIKQSLSSIHERTYENGTTESGLLEIDNLFDFLAQKDKEYEDALLHHQRHAENLQNEIGDLQNAHEKTQAELARLAYSRKQEIDPDNYRMFLAHLHTLTPSEQKMFNYYLEGKTAKEIMALMEIKESTLKWHNRNIYDKLGVTSRKELLRYAALMKQETQK